MIFPGQPLHAVRLGQRSACVVERGIVTFDGHVRSYPGSKEALQDEALGAFGVDFDKVRPDLQRAQAWPDVQAAYLVFYVRVQVMLEKRVRPAVGRAFVEVGY